MSNERATCTVLTGHGLNLEKVAQGDLQEGHLDKAVFMLDIKRRLECFSNECASLSRGCEIGDRWGVGMECWKVILRDMGNPAGGSTPGITGGQAVRSALTTNFRPL